MKTYKVTFKMYHESFSGHDQCDGDVACIVQAQNERSAIKKSKKYILKTKLNPGKGRIWSQFIWIQSPKVQQIQGDTNEDMPRLCK